MKQKRIGTQYLCPHDLYLTDYCGKCEQEEGMTDERRVRVLRDTEEEEWVVAILNENLEEEKIVPLDQIFIPVHLIMEVAEQTSAVCHDDNEDLNTFFKALVQRWASEGYTPTPNVG